MDEMLLMPSFAANMTEARLSRWLVNEGDKIEAGDVVAEVETDKATMEIEAKMSAVLGKILVAGGTDAVAVNTPIARLVSGGVQISEKISRIFASPLARRIAFQKGLDLSGIKGSGPGGRIIRQDIEQSNFMPMKHACATPALTHPSATLPRQMEGGQESERAVGPGLASNQQASTDFHLTVEIEVDALLALRAEMNARFAKSYSDSLEISVDDMVVKAAAISLRRIPQLNLRLIEGKREVCKQVDISIAVFLPDGPVMPVIRQADEKGLAELSKEIKSLTEQANSGSLQPAAGPESCFSISSMNERGIKTYQTSLPAAGAVALAISSIEQQPVIKNGQFAVATIMSVTLSADRYVVDESIAASWINSFKALLQEPLSMML